MADRNVKYVPCHGKSDINCIKVEVDYSLGGMNYFSGSQNRRGYYLYVTPIYREQHSYGFSESHTLLGPSSGRKHLLKEVSRKSNKAFAEACSLAEKLEKEIIDYVCAEAGVVLDGAAVA